MFIVVFVSAVWICVASADVCPCESLQLCQPIGQERDFEVFVFDVGRKAWRSYNWDVVTTVAAFGKYDPELMCYAHSRGARVVLKGDVFVPYIVDPGNRTAWIADKVALAKAQFLDGINIDIEHAVEAGSPEYQALTALVRETSEAFHREIPGSQSCDLLFVMSYDEQSQIPGDCIAMANAPVTQTIKGYYQYLELKIDPKKLVMGVPWYGYDYSCLNLSQEGVCSIEKVPFRGVPCSDAAGKQKTYSWIMKQVNDSITGRLWDQQQQAPYFNYEDEKGQLHQVWYDDPESICLKASLVKAKGLRGIGMWNGNLLNYIDESARQQTNSMWNALVQC
ncbi:hypothetical protein CRUP_020712 [Coryphaenoides rupestris]|nr:hypothetical protein CRUP_020712 [Coryphaenoides rupestris]